MWSKVAFAGLFVAGAALALTVNIQLSLGAILMVVAYEELRKRDIPLNQIDDILKDKIEELLKKNQD